MSVIIPLNKSKTKFEGLIQFNTDFFRISIDRSSSPPRFTCDWKLRHKLQSHLTLIENRLVQCTDIQQFLEELKLLLNSSTLDNDTAKQSWNAKYYDVVLQHLQALGWDKVVNVSDNFLKIKLKAVDSSERQHFLDLTLSFNYPKVSPGISVTLPLPFEPLWTSDSDFVTIYKQFKLCINQFERLWDNVEELKENSWILEPESPNFAATSFRIALSSTSSIQVKVDSVNVGVVPECHFLGAEWFIAPLRVKFQQKYEDWNENLSLFQNLKEILEVDFPEKQSSNSEDVILRCGICYAFRLGMAVPDQICNDKRCGQPFHHECLLEWLRSIPSSKQSFNYIFGECPYCTQSMKVNIVRT